MSQLFPNSPRTVNLFLNASAHIYKLPFYYATIFNKIIFLSMRLLLSMNGILAFIYLGFAELWGTRRERKTRVYLFAGFEPTPGTAFESLPSALDRSANQLKYWSHGHCVIWIRLWPRNQKVVGRRVFISWKFPLLCVICGSTEPIQMKLSMTFIRSYKWIKKTIVLKYGGDVNQ